MSFTSFGENMSSIAIARQTGLRARDSGVEKKGRLLVSSRAWRLFPTLPPLPRPATQAKRNSKRQT